MKAKDIIILQILNLKNYNNTRDRYFYAKRLNDLGMEKLYNIKEELKLTNK